MHSVMIIVISIVIEWIMIVFSVRTATIWFVLVYGPTGNGNIDS